VLHERGLFRPEVSRGRYFLSCFSSRVLEADMPPLLERPFHTGDPAALQLHLRCITSINDSNQYIAHYRYSVCCEDAPESLRLRIVT
jgi:hypothetical protein